MTSDTSTSTGSHRHRAGLEYPEPTRYLPLARTIRFKEPEGGKSRADDTAKGDWRTKSGFRSTDKSEGHGGGTSSGHGRTRPRDESPRDERASSRARDRSRSRSPSPRGRRARDRSRSPSPERRRKPRKAKRSPSPSPEVKGKKAPPKSKGRASRDKSESGSDSDSWDEELGGSRTSKLACFANMFDKNKGGCTDKNCAYSHRKSVVDKWKEENKGKRGKSKK